MTVVDSDKFFKIVFNQCPYNFSFLITDFNNIRKILSDTPGIIVQDDVDNNVYPMPRLSENKDEVFVGRLRRDESREKSLNMWVVSDNLRKGAATNAIQIAEKMMEMGLLG